MLFKIGFIFGRSDTAEGGTDEAGAVFARDALPRLQFIAQRQQLLHFRHNQPLFCQGWERKRLMLELIVLQALNSHSAFDQLFEYVTFVSTEHQTEKRT